MASTVPLWLVLAPSVVAVAAIAAAELRDWRRLKHEREMRLRDERIEAYRKLLAATAIAYVNREVHTTLAKAYTEISLLASTDEIAHAAREVWLYYGLTQRISDQTKKAGKEPGADFAQALSTARKARNRFLALAHAELGVKGRSHEDLIPYPEPPSSRP